MDGHEGAILEVRWAPNGRHAITAGKDRTVRLWNPATGMLVKAYEHFAREVRSAAAEESGARIAACGADKGVVLTDVQTGRLIRRLRGHGEGGAHSVAWRGCEVFATGGYDRQVRFWDGRSWNTNPVDSVSVASDAVLSVHVPTGSFETVAACADGTIAQIDIRQMRVVCDWVGGPAMSLALSGDEECCLVSCIDDHEGHGVARLFDRKGGEPLASYRGFSCRKHKVGCCLAWDDSHALVGGEDGSICAWELVSAELRSRFRPFPASVTVTSLAQHSRRPLLLAAATDGSARLLTGEEAEVYSVLISLPFLVF